MLTNLQTTQDNLSASFSASLDTIQRLRICGPRADDNSAGAAESGMQLWCHSLKSHAPCLLLSAVYTSCVCSQLSVQPAGPSHAVAAGEDAEGVSCGHARLLGPRPAAGPHPCRPPHPAAAHAHVSSASWDLPPMFLVVPPVSKCVKQQQPESAIQGVVAVLFSCGPANTMAV